VDTDSEDKVAPLSTTPIGDIVPILTNEDSESELELLKEIGSIDLS
jgi:hypothetical protein